MRALRDNRDIVTNDNPVEMCDRPRAVKAFGCFNDPVMMEGKFGQRAAVRPLVEIAHNDRWQMVRSGVDMP